MILSAPRFIPSSAPSIRSVSAFYPYPIHPACATLVQRLSPLHGIADLIHTYMGKRISQPFEKKSWTSLRVLWSWKNWIRMDVRWSLRNYLKSLTKYKVYTENCIFLSFISFPRNTNEQVHFYFIIYSVSYEVSICCWPICYYVL